MPTRPSFGVDDAKAAETLLRHDDDRLGHDLVFPNQRQVFARMHDVGDELEAGPQRAAGMGRR